MARTYLAVLAAAALVFGSGCSIAGVANPTQARPVIHLQEHPNQRLALLLPVGLRAEQQLGDVLVHDYTGTITRGFVAGFNGPYYVVDEDADVYLELTGLELSFDVADKSVSSYKGLHFTNDYYQAHIRYHARLLDGNRKELRRFAGEARSKEIESKTEATALLRTAVEAMYEEIADKLFWEAEAPKPAADGV